jgi:hypothetical protein
MSANPQFRDPNEPIPGLDGRTVGEFWQWAYSDVLSNRNRSILAEFIVGVALDVVDKPRVEWDAADLCYQGFKIFGGRPKPANEGRLKTGQRN